ncbi:lipopolysaccharide biosynthesis protein, partial [Thioclava sp. BHET1]
PSLSHWRDVLSFGSWAGLVLVLGRIFEFFPRLVLGRLLNFDSVGFLSRSLSITQLPDRVVLSAVHPVILPLMAQKARSEGDLSRPFLLALTYITGLLWPALISIALLADPLVRLLLGSQWHATVPLVQIVAVASMMLFPGSVTYPVLVALGQIRSLAWAGLIALPCAILIMAIASQFGLRAVAWSYFLICPIQAGTGLWFIHRFIRFRLTELMAALRPSLLVSLSCAVLPATLTLSLPGPQQLPLSLAILVAVLNLGIWAAGLFVTRHPLAFELRLIGQETRKLHRPGPSLHQDSRGAD